MLAQHRIAFVARDLFAQPLSAEEIRALTAYAPVGDLFSWRSPAARARGLQPGSVNEVELVALMAAEPRLIRRPLLLAGDRLVIGADADAIAGLR